METKNSYINWIDYNRENMLKEYSDYVEKIENDHELTIAFNMVCLVEPKKPSFNWRPEKVKYIKTKGRIVNTVIVMEWKNDSIVYYSRNFHPIKFCRLENINLLE